MFVELIIILVLVYIAYKGYVGFSKNKALKKNDSTQKKSLYTATITTNIPPDIVTTEAFEINKNRNNNILYIEPLSKIFHLTTDSIEVPSLNDDPSFINGDAAVKNNLWLYLSIVNEYNPNNYNNLKDALIAMNKISEQAYARLYQVYPSGLSYRTVKEINVINDEIIKYIRKIHTFNVFDFVNTDINHMVKATRNSTRYSKIIKRIDKYEVDELIGSYIENIISKLVLTIEPLALEKAVAKELRPAIIDVSYAYNIEKRPSRWKRESSATKVAIKLFKGHKIIQQGSPVFLGRQRYDIWIPSLNIAIEYNGRQHYEYVSFFHTSGMEDFIRQKKRDDLKRTISRDNNITLIEIPYTIDNIEDFLVNSLSELNIDL